MDSRNRVTVAGDTLIVRDAGGEREVSIFSPEGFRILNELWIRSSWHHQYSYTFSWLGIPIIQLPEDMIRVQEVLFTLQPDVIVETGIAHGGSLIFYASLCRAMGRGRVVGVDIEIRPHNRAAVEAHPLFPYITLIEGSSTAPEIVAQVQAHIQPGEKVFVMLDSNHTKAHVLAELEAYAPLVTPGSYIVAADGIMADIAGQARTQPDWTWNNPQDAVREFVAAHPDFAIEEPAWLFNESALTERVTYWPNAYVRRLR